MSSCSHLSYNGKTHKAKYVIRHSEDNTEEYICGMHLQSAIAIELAYRQRNGGAQFVVVSLVENKRGV